MDESDWRKYLRKLKWVAIALLAPEIVVFAGFEQWLSARHFFEEASPHTRHRVSNK
jgi:hypothetical protein